MLEAELANYQSLDPKKKQKERTKLKDKVADEILADPTLKQAFALQGIPQADIRDVSSVLVPSLVHG